jgi:hypothetical protein
MPRGASARRGLIRPQPGLRPDAGGREADGRRPRRSQRGPGSPSQTGGAVLPVAVSPKFDLQVFAEAWVEPRILVDNATLLTFTDDELRPGSDAAIHRRAGRRL